MCPVSIQEIPPNPPLHETADAAGEPGNRWAERVS
jgi:hypothetical protein